MLRDRTTLFMMVLLPIIIYPLISVISAYMFVKSSNAIKRSSTRITINRDKKEFSDAMRAHFKRAGGCEIKFGTLSTAEIQSAISKKELSIYIELPQNFDEKNAGDESVEIIIKYDLSNEKSSMVRTETTAAISRYRKKIVEDNISRHDISRNLIYPFDISGVNIATPSRMGGSLLARILPMLIIMFATLGSFYPAIDVTAMEKERGTLETLLLAPVNSLDIMLAKFFAVFCLTMFSIAINLSSISLTLAHGYLIIGKIAASSAIFNFINFSISPYSAAAIFIFTAPLACIMSALMMQVAIFARNFKEAQNYMTPILLIFMLPPMVSMLPGYSLDFYTAFIPVVNLTLLLKGMLISNYHISHALITFLVNFTLCILTLASAAKTFTSENILFRPSEDIDVLYFWKYKTLKINQEFNLLKFFFILQLIFLYYAGSAAQVFFEIKTGLFITEILFIFLPAFIFIKTVHGDFLHNIKFKLINFKTALFSVFTALCCFGFTTIITLLQSLILDPPPSMLKQLQSVIVAESARDFFIITVAAALLPALCEETMFRGMILSTLEKKYGALKASMLCGLFFGIFHFSAYRFIPTAIIGFYLSMLKISTGSIIPSMIAHFINNFIIIAAINAEKIIQINKKPSPAIILSIEGFILFSFIIFPFIIGAMNKKAAARASDENAL